MLFVSFFALLLVICACLVSVSQAADKLRESRDELRRLQREQIQLRRDGNTEEAEALTPQIQDLVGLVMCLLLFLSEIVLIDS